MVRVSQFSGSLSWGVSLLAVSAMPSLAQLSGGMQGRPEGSQLEAPLLQAAQCISSNTHRYDVKTLYTDGLTVPVNKRPYNSVFRLSSPTKSSTTIACIADSEKYEALILRMGMSDADVGKNPLATVNIYQGDNLKYSYNNVVSGSLLETNLLLDVGQENFAIELVCQRYGRTDNYVNRCNLHFLEAKFYITGDSQIAETIAAGKHTPPSQAEDQNSSSIDGWIERGEEAINLWDRIRRRF